MNPVRAALLTALFTALASTALHADPSNKWRLEVSGNAESDGDLGLSVLQVGSVVAEIDVPVAQGTSENDVARRLRDELLLQLPKGVYTVELDDGEDVLVKKQAPVEDFEVRVVRNSVRGVRVKADRE